MQKPRYPFLFFLFLIFSFLTTTFAQIGEVIWQDDFDHLDNWMTSAGNGSWGWGNGELQYYQPENVEIVEIPGEPGNYALCITARKETGAGIVDQWGNPLSFTSGKVTTKSKIAVQYGLIETRIRVPDLDLGGWPAFWLLGTSNFGWPQSGELDMMEMGHQKAFRDQRDEHNGGSGQNNSTVNEMTGANAIFYSNHAVIPGNPTGAASIAYDANYNRPYFNQQRPLNDRFVIYRMYWDEASIRFTVTDEGVEYDLYTGPFSIGEDSDEFRRPFYFIANLAIGGTLTDAYNLGDPNSGAPVSIPFPAKMYVDYVKVMQWNGQGSVRVGPPVEERESLGLYTDTTPTRHSLAAGDAEIYVWEGTLRGGSIAPYEGNNVLSWQTTGKGWFGAGIMSMQPVNLSAFGNGFLKFNIKIPANVSFRIGINDAWGNENYVSFPANRKRYGLERNGEWGEASIPVAAIRGTQVDLRMLKYEFVILEANGASCEFALDDIFWVQSATQVTDRQPLEERALGLSPFPNPFNSQTIIRFALPRNDHVRLEIFDTNGRRIETLINGYKSAGNHTVTWNADQVPSGVYIFKLTSGNISKIRKLTLVR